MSTSWFRSVIRGKTRIALAWAFAAILGISAREYPVWPGVAVCFLGATLRFWASGYLRKDSKPAIGGPYAFVRNPLYLGTYLMALGTVWAIQNYWLLGILTVLFAVVYHFIILDEETKLRTIFGAPYLHYCRIVPRFFPRGFPPLMPASRAELAQVNPEAQHLHFSMEVAMRNKAYEAYATFFGLIGFVWIFAYFWQSRG